MENAKKIVLHTHMVKIRAHLKQYRAIVRKEEGDKAFGMQLRAAAALSILAGKDPHTSIEMRNLSNWIIYREDFS